MKQNRLIKLISILFAATIPAGMFCMTANAAEYDPDAFIAADAPEQGDDSGLPSSYSSVEQGYVTSIKKQHYNDCWAYSTLAALETKLLKNGYQEVNMSEPHLNLWAMTRSDGNGWIRSYSDAALVYTGTGYLTSWQGGVLESDAGSITLTTNSKGDDAANNLARFGVTEIRYLSGEDRATIKRAIYENGAAMAAYSHITSYYKDRLTYCLPKSYSGRANGHMVTAVGWDDNYPKENFSTPPEHDGAWLIKNTWGNNNAEGGYFWISYEDKYIFSADKFIPVYAIESFEEITDRKKLIADLTNSDTDTLTRAEDAMRESGLDVRLDEENLQSWFFEVQDELKSYGEYDGLLILWDEFTDVMTSDIGPSLLVTLQELTEAAMNSKNDSYFFFISR